jgi:hypothetical protein
MNKLATVLLMTTIALAGACIYLAWQVGVARDATDAALAQANASRSVPPGVAATSAPAAVSLQPGSEAFPATAPGAPAAGVPLLDPYGYEYSNAVSNSPAARRVAVAETRSRIKQFNADFVALQGLEAAQARALEDMMTAHELGASGPDFTDQDEAQAFHEAREREFRKKILDLLGEQAAAEFDAYRSTPIPRAEIDQFAGQLDALGMPMTDEQRLRMLRAVVQDRGQFEFPEGLTTTDEGYIRAVTDFQEGQLQRLAAHARTVLTGPQLRHFEDILEREREKKSAEAQPAP